MKLLDHIKCFLGKHKWIYGEGWIELHRIGNSSTSMKFDGHRCARCGQCQDQKRGVGVGK